MEPISGWVALGRRTEDARRWKGKDGDQQGISPALKEGFMRLEWPVWQSLVIGNIFIKNLH